MRRVDEQRVNAITGDYNAWFQNRLKDKTAACTYLQVALDLYQEDKDKEALLLALKDVAEAQGGIGWLAKESQLNREHLYYLLSGKGHPKLDTLGAIFKAFGFRMQLALG